VFEITVENKGDKNLYVYLYDMGPRWQIHDIYRGSYEVINPKFDSRGFTGMLKKKLRTTVPQEIRAGEISHCEDTIRVFITS
jgi:hypothetical protein